MWEAMENQYAGVEREQSRVSGPYRGQSLGHPRHHWTLGRPENRMGAPWGGSVSPGSKGRRGQGEREALCGSHMGKSPWSRPWLEHRKAFLWEIRHGSLEEDLLHCSSMADPNEKRQSMVLRHLLSRQKVDE